MADPKSNIAVTDEANIIAVVTVLASFFIAFLLFLGAGLLHSYLLGISGFIAASVMFYFWMIGVALSAKESAQIKKKGK